MESIFCSLHNPTKVLHAGMDEACGELQEFIACDLMAKSQICRTIWASATKFYTDVGHALNKEKMLWTLIHCFQYKQHEALMAKKPDDLAYVLNSD